MSELDSLFKLDGDLDSLDKNVHQKCVLFDPLINSSSEVDND
jgi:hypothetical protein